MSELFRKRKKLAAYRSALLNADGSLSPEGEVIVADLLRFCKVKTTTHVIGDDGSSKILEGRRQVFNRIWGFLNLDVSSIMRHDDNADQEDHDENKGYSDPLNAP